MYLCLGGTFWPLHRGHDHLLTTALGSADRLLIGLSDDGYAAGTKGREIAPYETRREALEGRLRELMAAARNEVPFDIKPLGKRLDTSPPMDQVEGIALSRDMEGGVDALQALRAEAGQPPFKVIFADELLAADGLPVRSSRIVAGEIDVRGRIAGTVRVVVGTANDIKVRAVRGMFGRMYPDQPVEVTGMDVDSGVPEQPAGPQVMKGALGRARAVMSACAGDGGGPPGSVARASDGRGPPEPVAGAGDSGGPTEPTVGQGPPGSKPHFAVGIEAGLFWDAEGAGAPQSIWGVGTDRAAAPTFDVQYCAVLDRGGRVTWGHGPGFVYPDVLLEEVRAGKEVRTVMKERYWKDPSQRGKGAIHTFSQGLMDRVTLTETAVLMAMIPRISGEHGF